MINSVNSANSLVATALKKTYQQRQVVKDISLRVQAGEIVGLLGPNGAGKTTCFYLIAGLIASEQGSIFLNDQDLTAAPMHVRARAGLGYLPQEASIFRKLTVKENILAILEIQPQLTKAVRQEKTAQLLEEFSLTHLQDHYGISLSGGERRRAEIARALASSPKFILLDEPFAGVDPISVNDLKQQILQLSQKKIGVLITDHNVRETLTICHRATIVNQGTVIATGSPAEVLANPEVKAVYLGENFSL